MQFKTVTRKSDEIDEVIQAYLDVGFDTMMMTTAVDEAGIVWVTVSLKRKDRPDRADVKAAEMLIKWREAAGKPVDDIFRRIAAGEPYNLKEPKL